MAEDVVVERIYEYLLSVPEQCESEIIRHLKLPGAQVHAILLRMEGEGILEARPPLCVGDAKNREQRWALST